MVATAPLVALIVSIVAAAPERAGGPARYVDGELLVRFRDGRGAARAHAAERARLVRREPRLRMDRVTLPPGASVEDAARRYRRDPDVAWAEPNWFVRKSLVPNDLYWGYLWALPAIGAPAAWDVETGTSVVVAVIDTGIGLEHEDLAANLWVNEAELGGTRGVDDDGNGVIDDVHGARYRTTYPESGTGLPDYLVDGDPTDDDLLDSHGTHVAGTVAAVGDNGKGVAGVSWRARLMAVKVLHGNRGGGTIADAVDGIVYAVRNGARILNCSFGQVVDPELDEHTQGSDALTAAFEWANSEGALVVTAAGNDGLEVGMWGPDNPLGAVVMTPSIRTSNQISVAAVGPAGGLASYSNFGSRAVEVGAPGGLPQGPWILSTVIDCETWNPTDGCTGAPELFSGYAFLAGTSMAAPHVAGLAALVWSKYPALTHHQVKARILNAAVPVAALAGKTITGGRIDAAGALSTMAAGMPSVFRVSPSHALPGETVTITGANFGAASGVVAVGEVPLDVVTWSPLGDEIVAAVPETAASGTVQVNGEGSGFPLAVGIGLSATPRSGRAPLDVFFTANLPREQDDVIRWEWDVGDGFREYRGITSGAIVTYDAAGSHETRVRVTTAGGRTATASLRVDVAPEEKGFCFVATAAYGSPLHPHVGALRAFRDRVLMPMAPGRALVRAYYAASPPLADAIRPHAALRAIARAALAPLVAAASFPAAAGLAVLAIVAAGVLARPSRRRAVRVPPSP